MKAVLKRKYTKPKRDFLLTCYDDPDCTINYGKLRDLPSYENKTHTISPSERDVYLVYKDGRREYVYTHKFYSKAKHMLHVYGPLSGLRRAETDPLSSKAYVTYNLADRESRQKSRHIVGHLVGNSLGYAVKGSPSVIRVHVSALS